MWRKLLGWQRGRRADSSRFSKAHAGRRARRLFLEPLEQRQLLAAVTIPGTPGADTITIDDDANGGLLINGVLWTGTGPITSITINADDGADVININGVPTSGGGGSGIVNEIEPNDAPFVEGSPPTAFQSLETAGWSLASNADIGDADGFNVSQVYPHISVLGGGDGTVDFYRVDIPNNSVAVFDIDDTSAGSDTQLDLYDANGSPVLLGGLPVSNDDGLTFWGAGGSDPDGPPFDHDNNVNTPDVEQTFDAFISHGFVTGGTFYIRVSAPGGAPLAAGETYTLNIAIQNHSVAAATAPPVIVNGGTGIDTLNIDPGVTPGELYLGTGAFNGSFGDGKISYTSVENVGGTGTFKLEIELAGFGLQDGSADTTFIRPDGSGTQLLVDINGATIFAGLLGNIDDPVHNQDVTVRGTDDSDTITIANTVLSAVIYGNGGSDTITTAAGNDYVSGGAGNDTINGGGGQDRLYGNDGDDVLFGNGGNDLLSGGSGNDQLTGGVGRDVLVGGTGADTAYGNGDNDLFFASGAKHDVNFPTVDGDSQQVLDANDVAMLQLLADWSVFLTYSFTSTSNDGERDMMFGGAGDDEGVGDGSFVFVEQQPS